MAELSRKGVVEEAIRIADEHGLAAVTFRAIADRLGVHFTSIRHYVSTKEELLDAMADDLLGEAAKIPGGEADWQQVFRSLGKGMRSLAERHPGAVAVLTQRAAAGPNALDLVEASLAALERGGFTRKRAAMALAAFNSMVIGLTLEGLGATNADDEPVVDPVTHPRVAKLAGTEVRHWDFSVNALIAGLAAAARA